MINGSLYQETIMIINMYAPNFGAPKYIKQTLTEVKEEINSNARIVGEFNTPLSKRNRSFRKNINKEAEDLTNTVDKMVLTDIYRIFHLITEISQSIYGQLIFGKGAKSMQWRKDSLINGAGKIGFHMQKNETRPLYNTLTRIN